VKRACLTVSLRGGRPLLFIKAHRRKTKRWRASEPRLRVTAHAIRKVERMRYTKRATEISLLTLLITGATVMGCPYSQVHPYDQRPLAAARVDWGSCNCSDCLSEGPTVYTGSVSDFREVVYNCTSQQCDDLGPLGFSYQIPSEYVPGAWECGPYDADLVVEAVNEVLSGPNPEGPARPCVGKSGVNVCYAYNVHGEKHPASETECPR